jgi:transposase
MPGSSSPIWRECCHCGSVGATQGADGIDHAGEARSSAGQGGLSAHADVLISWVDAEGDVTMPELAVRLFKEHGVKAHPASLSRLLLAHGFTVKKNSAGERNRSR